MPVSHLFLTIIHFNLTMQMWLAIYSKFRLFGNWEKFNRTDDLFRIWIALFSGLLFFFCVTNEWRLLLYVDIYVLIEWRSLKSKVLPFFVALNFLRKSVTNWSGEKVLHCLLVVCAVASIRPTRTLIILCYTNHVLITYAKKQNHFAFFCLLFFFLFSLAASFVCGLFTLFCSIQPL